VKDVLKAVGPGDGSAVTANPAAKGVHPEGAGGPLGSTEAAEETTDLNRAGKAADVTEGTTAAEIGVPSVPCLEMKIITETITGPSAGAETKAARTVNTEVRPKTTARPVAVEDHPGAAVVAAKGGAMAPQAAAVDGEADVLLLREMKPGVGALAAEDFPEKNRTEGVAAVAVEAVAAEAEVEEGVAMAVPLPNGESPGCAIVLTVTKDLSSPMTTIPDRAF
jgi:hypothetical protein